MINKFQVLTYVEIFLKKNISDCTKTDFDVITNIEFVLDDKLDLDNQMTLGELIDLFPNLSSVTISDSFIVQSIIDELSNLKLEKLSFVNCGVYSGIYLGTLDKLVELNIINCNLLNYDFLKHLNRNLNRLRITKPKDEKNIDLSSIKEYTKINELILEKCNIYNVDVLSNFKELKLLSFFDSYLDDVDKISSILNIDSLSEIYLPLMCKDLVSSMKIDKNIKFNLIDLMFEQSVE